jgi:hypothetical protein
MPFERVKLTGRDCAALIDVLFGEGFHVTDKVVSNRKGVTPASLSANFFSHFEAGQKFDVALLASDAALADAFFFL